MNLEKAPNSVPEKAALKVTLSKYDQERQRKALEHRREHPAQEQVVMGKKFEGESFVAKPEVIEFKDFSLNEPHLRTFLLTNVSNSFNSFKVAPIEDQYRVTSPLPRTSSRSTTSRPAA
jgi:hypothetical protein